MDVDKTPNTGSRAPIPSWAAAMGISNKAPTHTAQPAVPDNVTLALEDPAAQAWAVQQLMDTSALHRESQLRSVALHQKQVQLVANKPPVFDGHSKKLKFKHWVSIVKNYFEITDQPPKVGCPVRSRF